MSRIEMTTPAVPAFAKFAERISVPASPSCGRATGSMSRACRR